MALSVSGLTEVINRYLNSISDSGKVIEEATKTSENRRVFRDTLGEAIKAEIAGKTPQFPDIPSVIQQNMESRMRVDTTFDTKEAEETAPVKEAAGATAGAGVTEDMVKELVKAISSSDTASTTANKDAFKGQLSTQALQELAGSSYFSGNLIQSNLFTEDADSSSASSASGNGLSELNARSLLAAYLNKGSDIDTSVFGDFLL
ncbi:MAG: hypothetical protein E7307_03940 [Butyrivibrio sp.]|nr:hypothetical protein [Butyrivibrio sp.]